MKILKDLEEEHQKWVRGGGKLTLAENGEKFARFRLRDPFIVAGQTTFGGRMCLRMHARFGGRTWSSAAEPAFPSLKIFGRLKSLRKHELGKSRFGRRTLHAYGGTFGPRTWPGQPPIKGALSRNGRVFSHFQPQQASDLPLPNLVFFLQSPPFSLSFKVPQKFLSVFKQVWSLEVLELNPSIFRARVVLPLDLQEVSFDLCFFYVL